jgi:voltage-gated potassium channel
MHAALKTMNNHLIVCGFGRMGRVLCRHLAEKGLPFVALDRNESALAVARDKGWPWLVGDATDDASLAAAGIDRARGLAVVLDDDADNVYVVLSARLLSKRLQIIARASDDRSVSKLVKAGADRVVSLYEASATKVAQLMASPNLEDFMEIFTGGASELDLAEIRVSRGSPYAGCSLENTDLRARGVIVVGIRRGQGELLLPPPSSTTIEADDSLIAVGKAHAIAELVARA